MTADLVAFLRARLDEDEAVALAASPSPWSYGDVESVAGGMLYDETRRIADLTYEQPRDHDGQMVRHLLSDEADANGAHIARHDPARVLRQVEAGRAIVERAAKAMEAYDAAIKRDRYSDESKAATHAWVGRWLCAVDLAAIYRDHEDYREEWSL